jgi:non-ribosomal peptide synthetase component F
VIPDGLVNPDAIEDYMQDKEELMETVEESYIDAELSLELKDQDDYETNEAALLALLEFSGLGYEAEAAFKATWLRAVRDGDNPFNRVVSLAETTYSSKDSDLLPKSEEGI